jgi:FtsH ternary system domain X2
MCNPRRVTIQLTRTVQEAWRTTVEQAARAEGEVQEVARVQVDIPLAREMGERPLEMFECALRGEFEGCEPWTRDEQGNYRRELEGVTLIYESGRRQLLVEARLAEQISAEAHASAEASGFTAGEVMAEAMAGYYEDNWGGHTEERARRQAQAEVKQRLDTATAALHRQQHAAELSAAEREAREKAQQAAAADLERRRRAVRPVLRERLQETLDQARDSVGRTVNRLVGEAYRQTLLAMARENGGKVLSDRRTGSVIHLELEV